LYVYVFSGGFNDYIKLDFDDFSKKEIIIYTSKIYFSAFFEEILFRGVILGILLFKFKNSNNFILKSVFVTSLLFGFTHIINIWLSEMSPRDVFNQVYATFSLGFLYSVVYLKTKNIYVLIFIHFTTNFFSQIGGLESVEVTSHTIKYVDKTNLQLILSELIRLIIFGIPLFAGIFILNRISKKEVSMLLK
jgi:membrane protease YdiL (CAAX protease family)